jgi:hypothetical protein
VSDITDAVDKAEGADPPDVQVRRVWRRLRNSGQLQLKWSEKQLRASNKFVKGKGMALSTMSCAYDKEVAS